MNEIEIKYLDKIKSPKDLDTLNDDQLKELASELRYDVIEKVSKTGGHLGASLGVVELTIALHKYLIHQRIGLSGMLDTKAILIKY